MRVEDVRVEQVQRVVQHRVPDVGDLPGGAHRIAEVGRDAAGHVQHERPAREHGERDAGDDHPEDLLGAQLRRGRPARPPHVGVAGGAAVRVRAGVLAEHGLTPVRRRRGARDCGGSGRRTRGAGDPGAHRLLVFATAGSAQHTGAAFRTTPPATPAIGSSATLWRTGPRPMCQSEQRICVTLAG